MQFLDLKKKPYLIQLVISSMAYGGGLLAGNLFSFFLFDQVPAN